MTLVNVMVHSFIDLSHGRQGRMHCKPLRGLTENSDGGTMRAHYFT